MNIKTISLLLLAILGLCWAGCVDTVSDRKKAVVPFAKDKVSGRYERSPEKVFEAAKEVIVDNGKLLNEQTVHNETNGFRSLQGTVKNRTVWMRVQPVDAKVTEILVQARTKAGGTDVDLAHEMEKQVALKLVGK